MGTSFSVFTSFSTICNLPLVFCLDVCGGLDIKNCILVPIFIVTFGISIYVVKLDICI